MPTRPWITWDRWWTPLGGPIHLEQAGGFLANPVGELGDLYPLNVLPLADLLGRHCLILCGEPGMGKTAELDEFEKRSLSDPNQPEILRLNFRSCLDASDFQRKTFGSTRWKKWKRSKGSLRLIIDGVDEGLWLAPNFLEWFLEELGKNIPLDRLFVSLACRTLEWPYALGAQLAALWGEPRSDGKKPTGSTFELCPLTRGAVVKAADSYSTPSNDFLRTVHEKQIQALAARPLTLFMLLDEFRDRGGVLNHTHRELYLEFCSRLCREPDTLRDGRLRRRKIRWLDYTPSQIQVVAGRIAAMMLISAKNSVLVRSKIQPGSTDLLIRDIASGQENDGGKDFAVTDDLVEASLATGLFNAKGDDRFGFEHQTFAECLAAQYLAKIDFSPLRTMLLRRDRAGEYVVPQLGELASWLAAEREDIFQLLLATQPEILLRTDLSHLADARKQQVVEALLRKAASAEYFERHEQRRPFYAALAHPELADQLRPTLLDRSKNNTVRWLALDIATACKCHELFPAILKILKRRDDPVSRQAGYALDDLVTFQTASQLIPIANGNFTPQQPRAVRITALRGLVNTVWSVSEALPIAKRIVRSSDFLDWSLVDRVRPSDVKPGLKAISDCESVFDSLFRLQKTVMRIFEFAFDQLGDEEVVALLSEILFRELNAFRLERWRDAGAFGEKVEVDPNKRRILIAAIHRAAVAAEYDHYWHLASLCLPEDLPWLMDCTEEAGSEEERNAYIGTIGRMLRPEILVLHWDDFISRVQNCKALHPLKAWITPWTLSGRKARKARSEQKKWRAQHERHRRAMEKPKLPERISLVQQTLAAFRQGKPGDWIRLSRVVFITDAREWVTDGQSHDITTSPGWIAADGVEREEMRAIARDFLLSHPKEFVREPNRSTYGAEAAFAAAWLLRDELSKSGDLQQAFAKNSVLAVVWHFGADDAAVAELTALIYSLNPKRCREAYLEELEFDSARDQGITLASRSFAGCWDSALTQITETFLISKSRRPETIRSILAELASYDLPAIPRIWRALIKRLGESKKPDIRRFAAATELMLELFAEQTWDELFPILKSNPDLTRAAVLSSAHYGRGYGLRPTQELSEEHLSDLYLLLYRTFLPSDPEEAWPDDGEPRKVTARHDAARFRDSLLERLVARGTPAGCDQLRRISQKVAKDDRLWMRKRRLDCVELVRRKAWQPLSAGQLLEIARRRKAFWIENEDDLLLVVIESLNDLQRSISGSPTGEALDFWDYRRKGGRISNRRPKSEIDVARKIYVWLRNNLQGRHGAIIQREVAIQWDQRRTDIEIVVAAEHRHAWRELTVVVEVKLAWNAKVRTDAKEQLRIRYLERGGKTHGIYLVAWFECDSWKPSRRKLKAKSLDAAKQEVASICRKARSAETTIASYVLDCSLPS
jgi:hypothetical protein